MPQEITDLLLRQHEIAWSLASYHLEDLNDNECMWRPSTRGLHVAFLGNTYRGEWPDHEGYDLGPPSIAWTIWHIGFWWSMAINHSFGDSSFNQESITCPSASADARSWLQSLHEEWKAWLSTVNDQDMRSSERTKFPFRDRPFSDVVAWVNIELTKNASEIGYARFLYATRTAA
ncbi:MAG TPA: DinB family protein [Halieaceae bacterium]|nr:DinB family protein [Halieaceae bacterium]